MARANWRAWLAVVKFRLSDFFDRPDLFCFFKARASHLEIFDGVSTFTRVLDFTGHHHLAQQRSDRAVVLAQGFGHILWRHGVVCRE